MCSYEQNWLYRLGWLLPNQNIYFVGLEMSLSVSYTNVTFEMEIRKCIFKYLGPFCHSSFTARLFLQCSGYWYWRMGMGYGYGHRPGHRHGAGVAWHVKHVAASWRPRPAPNDIYFVILVLESIIGGSLPLECAHNSLTCLPCSGSTAPSPSAHRLFCAATAAAAVVCVCVCVGDKPYRLHKAARCLHGVPGAGAGAKRAVAYLTHG